MDPTDPATRPGTASHAALSITSSTAASLIPPYAYAQRWNAVDAVMSNAANYVPTPLPTSQASRQAGVQRTRGLLLLACDGGGSMGVVPATILHEIELELARQLGQQASDVFLADYFDLVCGTSAGGMIALAHAHGRMRLSTVQDLFQSGTTFAPKYGSATKSWPLVWQGKYDVDRLEAAMEEAFVHRHGPNADAIPTTPRLDDGLAGRQRRAAERNDANLPAATAAKRPHVFCVTNPVDTLSTVLLSNYPIDEYTRFATKDVATFLQVRSDVSPAAATRATSAAPTYFPAKALPDTDINQTTFNRYHWDGGLVNNSPVGLAVTQARMLFGPHRAMRLVLSLGCGTTMRDVERETQGGRSVSMGTLASTLGNALTNSRLEFEQAFRSMVLDPRTASFARAAMLRIDPVLSHKGDLDSSDPVELAAIANDVRHQCRDPASKVYKQIQAVVSLILQREDDHDALAAQVHQQTDANAFHLARVAATRAFSRLQPALADKRDIDLVNQWTRSKFPPEPPQREALTAAQWRGVYERDIAPLVRFLQLANDTGVLPPLAWAQAKLTRVDALGDELEHARFGVLRDFFYPMLDDVLFLPQGERPFTDVLSVLSVEELTALVRIALAYDKQNALHVMKFDVADPACPRGFMWVSLDDMRSVVRPILDNPQVAARIDPQHLAWINKDRNTNSVNRRFTALLRLARGHAGAAELVQTLVEHTAFAAPQWLKEAYPGPDSWIGQVEAALASRRG